MGADSSGWWKFVEFKGLTRGAPRHVWDGAIAKLQDWLILNPAALAGAKWDLIDNVPRNEEHEQLSSKLWPAATARGPMASDVRRNYLSLS